MRAVLDLCVAMDDFAHRTYDAMAAACPDPDLSAVFTRLATEERTHIIWWQDLLGAWEQGLVPDVVNDTDSLEQHMITLLKEMRTIVPADLGGIPVDTTLDIAAHLEFLLLDPVFGEFLDLTEPGGANKHREEYARHLEHLIGAIEMFYSRSDLAVFLTRVLRRAWRDNLALAAFATRDPLTAMYNRRGLMSYLDQWVSWAGRYGHPLGLLLVDVDDFKNLNDTYGHAVGDIALKTVSEALSDAVRGSDLVARYGGDEFAVVAPETGAEELATLACRLTESVAEASLKDWDGTEVALSVSVGGCVMTDPGARDTSIDGLLSVADRSLYTAKRSGKARAGEILVYSVGEPSAD